MLTTITQKTLPRKWNTGARSSERRWSNGARKVDLAVARRTGEADVAAHGVQASKSGQSAGSYIKPLLRSVERVTLRPAGAGSQSSDGEPVRWS